VTAADRTSLLVLVSLICQSRIHSLTISRREIKLKHPEGREWHSMHSSFFHHNHRNHHRPQLPNSQFPLHLQNVNIVFHINALEAFITVFVLSDLLIAFYFWLLFLVFARLLIVKRNIIPCNDSD
jgi:hypothetical protein